MTDNPSPEPSSRSIIAAFVIVTLAIVGGAVLLLVSRPDPVQITINPPVPTATPEPTATPLPIEVYITGAVGNPQTTHLLPVGSRVQVAIDAAGGMLEDADLDRVNLSGILRDGDHVHVPRLGEADGDLALATPSSSGLVRINSATLEELDTLPGIGPALAERIIAYREANGPITDLDMLGGVSGIGPALLEGLEGMIEFD